MLDIKCRCLSRIPGSGWAENPVLGYLLCARRHAAIENRKGDRYPEMSCLCAPQRRPVSRNERSLRTAKLTTNTQIAGEWKEDIYLGISSIIILIISGGFRPVINRIRSGWRSRLNAWMHESQSTSVDSRSRKRSTKWTRNCSKLKNSIWKINWAARNNDMLIADYP